MPRIEITTWRPGFKATTCIQLLCSSTGISVADARRLVEGVLAGNPRELSVRSAADARMLVKAIDRLGASARLLPEG